MRLRTGEQQPPTLDELDQPAPFDVRTPAGVAWSQITDDTAPAQPAPPPWWRQPDQADVSRPSDQLVTFRLSVPTTVTQLVGIDPQRRCITISVEPTSTVPLALSGPAGSGVALLQSGDSLTLETRGEIRVSADTADACTVSVIVERWWPTGDQLGQMTDR